MKKESNNKGFSLVELIIVVAIMAILMVVLAPTFTKYVDRSRQSSDASVVAGIVSAMEAANADSTDYPGVANGKYEVKITTSGASFETDSSTGTGDDPSVKDMQRAVQDACGDLSKLKRTAKKWTGDLVITAEITEGVMKITYAPEEFAKYINKEATPAAGGDA